jgi:thiosulfate dehydrogenase
MLALAACGPSHTTYAQYGSELAADAAIANNHYNHFDCLTCHGDRAANVGNRIFPGAVLEGATGRPSWWGGNVLSLDRAVDDCYEHFMLGPPLDPNGDVAQALDAYLMQLAAGAPSDATLAVPFTVPASIHDFAPGDSSRGAELWTRACQSCHGDLHTGNGRILPSSIVPEDTVAAHSSYGPACLRDIFIEKIRHGSFLGYAGQMPPFSMEVLTDAQVADILAYLGAPAPDGGAAALGACPGVPAM